MNAFQDNEGKIERYLILISEQKNKKASISNNIKRQKQKQNKEQAERKEVIKANAAVISADNSITKFTVKEIILDIWLNQELLKLLEEHKKNSNFDMENPVITTERASKTTAQVIVNFFSKLYSDLGFSGASSHSGRRTFITNAAKKINQVGGSLRDVQALAGHRSLQTTQRYIEYDSDAQRKLVDII